MQRPFSTFSADNVPKSFRIIVLSNLAEYIRNLRRRGRLPGADARSSLQKIIRIATSPRLSPYGNRSLTRVSLGNHGLYLSHLNVILGAFKEATGQDDHLALNRRISRHLARRSLSDPHRHMASYPNIGYRWPADQAVTLSSLATYDRNYGRTLARRPVAAWLTAMNTRGMNGRWGLPRSEITGRARHAHTPRGCALSWSVRYMHSFAPLRARKLWRRYREVFMVRVGPLAGFREWPPGVTAPADADSGPIVFGMGAAATGLALGASQAVGDGVTYGSLRASEALVRAVGGRKLRRTGSSILARALDLQAATMIRVE